VAKFQSPLLGYNNNVRHKGRVFHIQTEDSGVNHPHIITHLFMDGGRILKSVKKSYAEHVGTENMSETVRVLMKEQHKAMFASLKEGAFDHLVDPKSEAKPKPAPAPAPKSETIPPPTDVSPPAFGRDDSSVQVIVGTAELSTGDLPLSDPALPLSEPALPLSEPALPLSDPALPLSDPALPLSDPAPPLSEPALPLSDPALPLSEAALAASEPVPKTDPWGEAPNTLRERRRASAEELTLDFDALDRDLASAPSPVVPAPALPPPPASLFNRYEPGTGQYRAFGGPKEELRAPRPQTWSSAPKTIEDPRPSIFGEDLVEDKSLDEVILSYLAEDLDPPRRK